MIELTDENTLYGENVNSINKVMCESIEYTGQPARLIMLTGNRLYWSVGSGCGCYCTHCCCGGGCCCWKRNCITEKEISWFAFFGQQVRCDLNSVFFSWLYSIQCHIGPVDCYWRLV